MSETAPKKSLEIPGRGTLAEGASYTVSLDGMMIGGKKIWEVSGTLNRIVEEEGDKTLIIKIDSITVEWGIFKPKIVRGGDRWNDVVTTIAESKQGTVDNFSLSLAAVLPHITAIAPK